jgi:hypothetical protein
LNAREKKTYPTLTLAKSEAMAANDTNQGEGRNGPTANINDEIAK